MQRCGQIIRLKPGALEEYRRIHRDVWTEVLATIRQCNIHNYSIYHKDGHLFAYFEYTGSDFKADMARMAADPKTQAWWKITDLLQDPLPGRTQGEWWATMEEVFHVE